MHRPEHGLEVIGLDVQFVPQNGTQDPPECPTVVHLHGEMGSEEALDCFRAKQACSVVSIARK